WCGTAPRRRPRRASSPVDRSPATPPPGCSPAGALPTGPGGGAVGPPGAPGGAGRPAWAGGPDERRPAARTLRGDGRAAAAHGSADTAERSTEEDGDGRHLRDRPRAPGPPGGRTGGAG